MKTVILNFLILLFSFSVFAQSPVILDIKTKFSEKIDLAPAKTGTILLLSQSDWAVVRDFGEKYSVWLTNYKREKKGTWYSVSLTIELRTPSMIRTGALLETRTVSVSVDGTETEISSDFFEKLKNEMKGKSDELVKEGAALAPEIVTEIKGMIGNQ
ncbi:MAG: hypothetical protein LCH54_13855 [Bacteroidetes bacterium]|nr:hypothetical protein [Bacteroidota bacterium]